MIMDFLLGMIVGMGWWMIIPLLIVASIFEHNERHGWTFFLSIVALGAAALAFSLSWTSMLYVALAWIPIGMSLSCWRWKRRCEAVVNSLSATSSQREMDRGRDYVNLSKHMDTVVYWVFCWPFGLLEIVIGDAIDLVASAIKRISKRTYHKWSADALASIDALEGK